MTIDDITTPAYIIDENILVHNRDTIKDLFGWQRKAA